MSYSSLILKDSPQAVWALEETSGLLVSSDSFSGPDYNGTYYKDSGNVEKFVRTGVPITYGGKVCISNNQSADYTSDRRMFSIPSLKNLSSSKRYKPFTLEFWMNLDNNEVLNLNSSLNKIGETKIVGWSGASNSGIYLKDMDYLLFRVGDTGFKASESAVHIPSFNTPLHVVASYDGESIELIVNGMKGKKEYILENIFGPQQARTIDFLFPSPINSNSGTLPFSKISYDTIAIYPYPMDTSTASRHYVYGLGYSITKNRISNLAGVSYGTDMQKTSPLKQFNYISSGTWSNNVTFNNLVVNPDTISTSTYSNQKFYTASPNRQANVSEMVSPTGDHFIFPADSYSYIEIENYESITDGTTKKIDAKFEITGSHSNSEIQQLMYIGSKIDPETYVSFVIEGKKVTGYYKRSGIQETKIGDFTLIASTKFFISIATNNESGNFLKIKIGASGSETPLSADIGASFIFPLQESFIRFGTRPVFFGNIIPENLSILDTKRFDGYLDQVDIYDSNLPTANYSSLQTKKISSKYQLYPNSLTRKYCVATSGSLEFTLSLLDICGLDKYDRNIEDINLAIRTEIGSTLSDFKYNLYKITGLASSPTSAIVTGYENQNCRQIHLPNLEEELKTQSLQYKITGTLRSSDTLTTPGVLEYFRIFTYETLEDSEGHYVEVNETIPSNNMRYYSGKDGTVSYPFKTLPDLDRNTDLHRSYNTGIKVGNYLSTKPYIKIPFNTATITESTTPKVHTIMFSGILNSGNKNNMSLFKYNTSTPITWSNIQPSGVTTYINGLPYSGNASDYDPYSWNHYTFVITSGIAVPSLSSEYINIYFGYPQESGAEWCLDNVNIFVSSLTDVNILNIYNAYFGTEGIRVGDGSASLLNVHIDDRELSDGRDIYQRILAQNEFIPFQHYPRLVSSSAMALTSQPTSGHFKVLYDSLTRNKIKLDDVEVNLNDIILLKNQDPSSLNGFYKVTDKQAAFLYLVKQTASYYTNNGVVFKPREGLTNQNWYFKKVSNSYPRTVIQKKVKGYTTNYPNITFPIPR
jgi:hypothetical protein